MICPNCRRELPDDTKFCGGCGTRMTPPAQQPAQPSVQYAEPMQYSQPVQFADPVFDQPNFDMPGYPADPASNGKKARGEKPQILEKVKAVFGKIPAKYLTIGGIAAAALVVAIVLICVFAGGSGGHAVSGQPEGALYLKDSQLYYSDFSKKAPYEVTDDLLDDASSANLRSYASDIANTIHVTPDGNTMFYMDKLDRDGTGTLYYRSLTNFGKDAVKISGGVSRYTVSENGKLVTYLKNGTLYQFDMKEEIKLGKDVSSYRVSGDGKIIYYRNSEGNWYVLKNGESEKIGNDITIEYITEDFSTVYYMNGDKLYKKTIGKDKEKLVSDVEGVTDIREDGTFYYAKPAELELSDFFVEDTDEYDGLMEMLAEETLEFSEIGYYNGKEGTIIGENCTDSDMTGNVLYYMQCDLSGAGGIKLTELVDFYYNSDYYYVVDAAAHMVQEQLAETEVTYIAVNGTTSVLEVENIYDMVVSQDEKTVYVLADVDYEKSEGTLYQVTLSGGKIKEVAEYDDGVYTERGCYYASYYGMEYSESFIYFKDVQESAGDLYVNGEMVDSDVYVRSTVRYNADRKELVYYVDYDAEKEAGVLKAWDGKNGIEIYDETESYSIMDNGNVMVSYDEKDDIVTLAIWNGKELTEISDDAYFYAELSDGDLLVSTDYSSKNYAYTLNLWNGKELTEISEDVYSYTVMPNGDVLYLYDYSTSKYEGELYLFNGKKAQLVDEDVAALITLPGTVTHYFD